MGPREQEGTDTGKWSTDNLLAGATHIIAMKDGQIVAEGTPRQVITSELVEDVFGLPNVLIEDPVTGGPMVVPLGCRNLEVGLP